MICQNCGKEYVTSVCPSCLKPVKTRSGLIVPQQDTLFEMPYSQGTKYARYFRIALLRADATHPDEKLAFGCEEKPFDYMKGKKSYFNPILITKENLPVLREMIFNLIAAQIAFETHSKGLKVPDQAATRILERIVNARNSGALQALAVRYLKMIE